MSSKMKDIKRKTIPVAYWCEEMSQILSFFFSFKTNMTGYVTETSARKMDTAI